MSQIFAAFGKSLGNNKGSVQNFGIVGVTIATEEIAKFVFFYCPCQYPLNKVYGSIFIWGPACILLIVGYLAHRRTWRLTTGLCNRTQGIGKGGKRIFHFIYIFGQIGMKAILAPATWVVLAFLKGDYYTCAKWPHPNDKQARMFYLPGTNASLPLPEPCAFNPNPIKFSLTSEAEVVARNLRAESHVIGWFYMCIGMLVGVIGMFISRCWSRFSYEQSNYIERYREAEVNLFEDALSAKAEEQAQKVVDYYFSKPKTKEDWDQIAAINDKVTKSKRGKPVYSPLHKYVLKAARLEDEETVKKVLAGIVSDSSQKKKFTSIFKKQGAENVLWKPKKTDGGSKNAGSNDKGGDGGAAAAMTMMALTSRPKQKVIVQQAAKPPPVAETASKPALPSPDNNKNDEKPALPSPDNNKNDEKPAQDADKNPPEIATPDELPEVAFKPPPAIPPPPSAAEVKLIAAQVHLQESDGEVVSGGDRPDSQDQDQPGSIDQDQQEVKETTLDDYDASFRQTDEDDEENQVEDREQDDQAPLLCDDDE